MKNLSITLCSIVATLSEVSYVSGQSNELSGSYTLDIHTGLNCLANQLDHGSNTLDEVMSGLPDGCVLYKYNNAAGTWTQGSFDAGSGTWAPPGIILAP